MLHIRDLDPDLCIEALEALPEERYSCHAITRALKDRETGHAAKCRHMYSDDNDPMLMLYASVFMPDEAYALRHINGPASSWLCVHGGMDMNAGQNTQELRDWRETALCFMAAIAADPWE